MLKRLLYFCALLLSTINDTTTLYVFIEGTNYISSKFFHRSLDLYILFVIFLHFAKSFSTDPGYMPYPTDLFINIVTITSSCLSSYRPFFSMLIKMYLCVRHKNFFSVFLASFKHFQACQYN